MKKNIGILTLFVAAIFLSSCGDDNDDTADTSDGESTVDVSLNPVRAITTLADFSATIVSKQLVFMNSDGTRNPDSQLVANAEMKVIGFTPAGNIDLDWYWDDAAFCRSGVSNLPDNPTTVELECQGVDIDNSMVNFTSNRGEGELASSWSIE